MSKANLQRAHLLDLVRGPVISVGRPECIHPFSAVALTQHTVVEVCGPSWHPNLTCSLEEEDILYLIPTLLLYVSIQTGLKDTHAQTRPIATHVISQH